jgi:hypothetical protein
MGNNRFAYRVLVERRGGKISLPILKLIFKSGLGKHGLD